jgi:hypothetical protein
MADPKIIDSPLSRIVEEDGISVDVRICRLEDTEWSLEIVANDGNSTVWNRAIDLTPPPPTCCGVISVA